MAEQAYLDEKLARFDPDFQLTSRFIASERRPRLAAIHALRAELRDLLGTIRDPGVAQAKLSWWREEWARYGRGEPRHPVTVCLGEASAGLPTGIADCLTSMADLLEGSNWERMDDLMTTARLLAAPLAALEADDPEILPLWRDIQAMALVQDLPAWWQLGRPLVPLDLAARLEVSPSELGRDPDTGARVLAELSRALLERLSPPGQNPQHAVIYHDLVRVRLGAWSKGRLNRPGPVGRLWVVWSAARRVGRAT